MRNQLHVLAALLLTKERSVLNDCEVRPRASQDVVEGNILMLSRIERRFLGRQAHSPSMPTTLDLRLEELVLRQWNGKFLLAEIMLGVCSGNGMKERQTAGCQFCHLSTTFRNNSSRYALTLLRPTDAACPLLVCSNFITFVQWCLCVSNFRSQFCQYVTAIDHLSLLLFPHLPIRFFASVSIPSLLIILLMALISSAFLRIYLCLFVTSPVFCAGVKLGCTH